MFRLLSVVASHFFPKISIAMHHLWPPRKTRLLPVHVLPAFAYVYSFICVNDLWVFLFLKHFCFCLLIFSCTGSLLLCVVSLAGEHRGCSVVVGVGFHCGGFRNTEHRLQLRAPVAAALKCCGSQAVECGLVVVVHRLSCSTACRREPNPCSLN